MATEIQLLVEVFSDVIDLLSNNSNDGLTLDRIYQLTDAGTRDAAASASIQPEPPAFKLHRLEARLGPVAVDEVVRRYESGESATAVAKSIKVAPSALLRLLIDKQVVVRKHRLTPDQDATFAKEYEAGATMVELEKKHQLSHGTVLRALRRLGVTMRPVGRKPKSESLLHIHSDALA